MNSLYELTSEYKELLEMLEDADLDADVIKDTLDGVEGEFEMKADAIAKVIAEEKGDAEKIDAEIKRLTARKKTKLNNAERLKKYLESAMGAIGKKKFATALFGFGIRKNAPAVVIDNEEKIPKEWWVEQEPKLDKAGLKNYLKNNETDYAHLEQSESLVIR